MLTKTTLLLLATFTVCFSFAQTDTAYSYLRLYFEPANAAYSNYVKLKAEAGNELATDLYNLKPVKIKEPDWGDPAYEWYKDKYKPMYDSMIFKAGNNAFRTITEGLNFLSAKGWQLYLVENNIQTNSNTAQLYKTSLPYTDYNVITLPDVTSKPVYIFRKRPGTL